MKVILSITYDEEDLRACVIRDRNAACGLSLRTLERRTALLNAETSVGCWRRAHEPAKCSRPRGGSVSSAWFCHLLDQPEWSPEPALAHRPITSVPIMRSAQATSNMPAVDHWRSRRSIPSMTIPRSRAARKAAWLATSTSPSGKRGSLQARRRKATIPPTSTGHLRSRGLQVRSHRARTCLRVAESSSQGRTTDAKAIASQGSKVAGEGTVAGSRDASRWIPAQ
jgi:hypothetical protein